MWNQSFFDHLQNELDQELLLIEEQASSIVQLGEKGARAVKGVMLRIRQYVLDNPFPGEREEINFFKIIKPGFYSKLMYYSNVFRVTSRQPPGNMKPRKKYWAHEIRKLDACFMENRDFYQYYRSGASYLDKQYFLRGDVDNPAITNTYYSFDLQFNSSHDYLVAELLANELFSSFISRQIQLLEHTTTMTGNTNKEIGKPLAWTAAKSALIELIYGLYATGVYNNGQVDLKDIARHFEGAYQIDLGNYYRVFQEIRIRKKSRTAFLEQLKEKLESKMDDADEHPRF